MVAEFQISDRRDRKTVHPTRTMESTFSGKWPACTECNGGTGGFAITAASNWNSSGVGTSEREAIPAHSRKTGVRYATYRAGPDRVV